ncbi:hypothetical protein JCM10908_003944 [Rhodotorula pacifica]|uniref:uncharacterized protein n=1 Tax=Rhodotorula pacifica TaxID=1495444 RepID=UPI00317E5723
MGEKYLILAVPGSAPGVILKQYARSQGDLSLGRAAKSDSSAAALDTPRFRSERTRVMSSKHAKITWSGDTPTIIDVGSTNGVRIRQCVDPTSLYECKPGVAYRINSGDIIIFGKPIQDPDRVDVMCQPLEVIAQVSDTPIVPLSKSSGTESNGPASAELERVPTIGNRRREELLKLQAQAPAEVEETADTQLQEQPKPANSGESLPRVRGCPSDCVRTRGFGITDSEACASLLASEDEVDDQNAFDAISLPSHSSDEERGGDVRDADAEPSDRSSQGFGSIMKELDAAYEAHCAEVDAEVVAEKIVESRHGSPPTPIRRMMTEHLSFRMPTPYPNKATPCPIISPRTEDEVEGAQKPNTWDAASQASHLPSPDPSDDAIDFGFAEEQDVSGGEEEFPAEEELFANGEELSHNPIVEASSAKSPELEAGVEVDEQAEIVMDDVDAAADATDDVEGMKQDTALLPSPDPEPVITFRFIHDPKEAAFFQAKEEQPDEELQDTKPVAAEPTSTQEEKDRLISRWRASLDQAVGEGEGPSQERLQEDNNVRAFGASQEENEQCKNDKPAAFDKAAFEAASLAEQQAEDLMAQIFDLDVVAEADSKQAAGAPILPTEGASMAQEDYARSESDSGEPHGDGSNREGAGFEPVDASASEHSGEVEERDSMGDDVIDEDAEQNGADCAMTLEEACAVLDAIDKKEPRLVPAVVTILKNVKFGTSEPEDDQSSEIDAPVVHEEFANEEDDSVSEANSASFASDSASIPASRPASEESQDEAISDADKVSSSSSSSDDDEGEPSDESDEEIEEDDKSEEVSPEKVKSDGKNGTADSPEPLRPPTGRPRHPLESPPPFLASEGRPRRYFGWRPDARSHGLESPARPPRHPLESPSPSGSKRRYDETDMGSLEQPAAEDEANGNVSAEGAGLEEEEPEPVAEQAAPKRRRLNFPLKSFTIGVLTGVVGAVAGLSAVDSFLGPA